jgi:hypothetical protein
MPEEKKFTRKQVIDFAKLAVMRAGYMETAAILVERELEKILPRPDESLKALEETLTDQQEQIADLRRQLNRSHHRPQFITEPDPFPFAVQPGACKPGAE